MAEKEPHNHRSRTITQGVQRTPNRAMLRAVGFGDDDFTKPIVGVASAYSTITPCNMGLNALAERAVASLRRAGTMPQIFGTITVSDGISMGTEGMKYSLVSREVIADSIETACNAQSMDGILVIGGCDKNIPGAMIAIARMDIPAVFVYGGTTKPGRLHGKDLTVVSAFEAVGQYSAHKITESELRDVERSCCPGAGSCGGMFTANTMSSAVEAMGLSLMYSSTMAAEDDEKSDSSALSAEVLARAIDRQILPSRLLTRNAFENAIAVVMAIGGSTNAVLHLLAIAHAAGVPLSIDDFESDPRTGSGSLRSEAFGQVRRDRLSQGGGNSAGDEDAPRARRPAWRCADDNGRDRRRAPRTSRIVPQAGQEVIRPWGKSPVQGGAPCRTQREPRHRRRGRKNHRRQAGRRSRVPRACSIRKKPASEAILAGRISERGYVVIRYEGPRGGPGMREMLAPTSAIIGAGLGDSVGIDHRRPVFRGDVRDGRRPCRAGGVRRRGRLRSSGKGT
jgi:dihydroxy-acid dehydratase